MPFSNKNFKLLDIKWNKSNYKNLFKNYKKKFNISWKKTKNYKLKNKKWDHKLRELWLVKGTEYTKLKNSYKNIKITIKNKMLNPIISINKINANTIVK